MSGNIDMFERFQEYVAKQQIIIDNHKQTVLTKKARNPDIHNRTLVAFAARHLVRVNITEKDKLLEILRIDFPEQKIAFLQSVLDRQVRDGDLEYSDTDGYQFPGEQLVCPIKPITTEEMSK